MSKVTYMVVSAPSNLVVT